MLFSLRVVLIYDKMKIILHQLSLNKMYPLSVDGAQTVNTSIIRNGLQMENISQMVLPPAEETEKKSQLSSARPRPDHLPLGSPDPSAHPLYLGVASLTGKLIILQPQ